MLSDASSIDAASGWLRNLTCYPPTAEDNDHRALESATNKGMETDLRLKNMPQKSIQIISSFKPTGCGRARQYALYDSLRGNYVKKYVQLNERARSSTADSILSIRQIPLVF